MRATALLLLAAATFAGDTSILPPVKRFEGKSRALALPAEHAWATPCERNGLQRTPRYAETVAWLRRLTAAAPELSMVSLGKSDEGRDVWMVIASRERAFTPAALRASDKPTFLAVAGIHSGEIDGKDAGMMLLRDMTVLPRKRELLAKANFLFVPIHSVDGHERFGPFGRVNQRGPIEMGWRTNSRNLNLNRDFAKIDTPELRALVRCLETWRPDLYYDIHVTDGADYQYDITWGYNGAHGWSPSIAKWLAAHLDPALNRDLNAMGHVPGPLVFAVSGRDMTKGNSAPTFGPRYSNGYGDARHLPTLLIENHSLKPYDQRVLGTYVLLESTLRVLGAKGAGLRKAIEADRRRRADPVPLRFERRASEPPKVAFLGVEQKIVPEPITDGDRVVWTGKPLDLEIPVHIADVPAVHVPRPRAYWIPPAWREVIERIAIHGIRFERIDAPREVEVELSRVLEYELDTRPFEGHVRVLNAKFEREKQRVRYAAGSVRVPTDQPLGDLAMLLLEPQSPDSFFQWGFFLEILQRTEYVENYAMAPLAQLMLKRDPKLKAEYDEKLAKDDAFKKDPRARLRWLYRKTPYFDRRWMLYPIGREG